MKQRLTLALLLALVLTFTACSGKKTLAAAPNGSGGEPAASADTSAVTSAEPPAEQTAPPADSSAVSSADDPLGELYEGSAETTTLVEAVGKTIENQRLVIHYLDASAHNCPPGTTDFYLSYAFDDGILLQGNALVWYGFADMQAYKNALNDVLGREGDLLRHHSEVGLCFAFYSPPAIVDVDGDGQISYAEVLRDFESYQKKLGIAELVE